MKIDRFIVALTSSDRFIELLPDPEGSLCFASEVVKLEAKCTELESKCAELLEASEAIVARWDKWKDQPHTPAGVFIDQLRAAIAKAKGDGI